MAISVNRANRHTAEWTASLARFPSRGGWGSSLYHACQIETAAEIIRRGHIICRHDQDIVLCDVANQGALWNNPDAHKYVRLYFRPKNRFHLKTEGIKSRIDPYRIDPHMSIPVMFVFDFVSVMTCTNSYFVSGNFASQALCPQQGDTNFDQLNFDYIYHDSPVPNDLKATIHDARMAEALIEGALSLQTLKAVVCRTIYEERMLRRLTSNVDVSNIRFSVEKAGSIFFRRGIYISELYTQDGVLHFDFAAPLIGRKETYAVTVQCGAQRNEYELKPQRWRIPAIVNPNPSAIWRVEIEGCLAFEGPATDNTPVVA